MPDGQVVFEITADDKGVNSTVKGVVSTMKKAGLDIDKDAQTTTNNVTSHFEGMFRRIAASATAAKAGQMLINFGKEAIQAASNLEETQNVVDTTFGESSSVIDRWAANAQKQYGLTETQAKRYASTMGAMAKSSGVTDDAIVAMSTDMAGLAADMASFYNLDFDEAFGKIRSGLAGETEPLRALGLNMTVKNLEDFARSQGVDKAFDKMTQAEQMSLRYQYLMQATADAQGDFVRTSDSYANSVRRLETNMETLKINAGEMLLPIVNDVVNGINTMVESLNSDDVKTAMQRLSEIGSDTADKKWDMNEQIQQARSLAAALDEIPESLQGGASGDRVRMGIIGELLNVMPELSSIIDAQTGEIEGGTAAVRDFISAWAETQGIEISLDDLSAKQDAVVQSTKDLEDAYKNLAKARGELAAAQGGWWGQAKAMGDESAAYQYISDHLKEINEQYGKNADAETWFETFAQAEGDALMAIEKAEREVSRLGGSLEEAQAAVEETANGLSGLADSAGNAGDAIDNTADSLARFSADAEASVEKALTTMEPALEQMIEMWESTRENIAANVEKMFDGFDFEMPELGEGAPTAASMTQSLQDQIDYIEEYQRTLEKVRDKGLNADILAGLTSGSAEDYDYLAAIADATATEIEELNAKYAEAKEAKDAFVTDLTSTKLENDSAFGELVDAVNTSMTDLETVLAESGAPAAMGSTMDEIIAAVTSRTGSLQSAIQNVVNLMAQLDSLSSSSFGYSSGGKGLSIRNGGGLTNLPVKSYAIGLDYVPFDGFLASLHAGESILTAEEARVWRNFKFGQQAGANSIDYGAMGSAIGANMPNFNGMTVRWKNGAILGDIVSEQQANNYNRLERSGWHG